MLSSFTGKFLKFSSFKISKINFLKSIRYFSKEDCSTLNKSSHHVCPICHRTHHRHRHCENLEKVSEDSNPENKPEEIKGKESSSYGKTPVKPISPNETKIHGNMKGMDKINSGIDLPLGVKSPTKKGPFVYRGNLNLDASDRSDEDATGRR